MLFFVTSPKMLIHLVFEFGFCLLVKSSWVVFQPSFFFILIILVHNFVSLTKSLREALFII